HHSLRQGAELQFQTLAKDNIDYMLDNKVKRVLTGCPHCFHTLLREYKELNPAFNVEVVHHSIFFWQLIRDKKLSLSMNKKWDKATYHDPCYLARIEARYKEPREIIKSCGINLIELSRNCSNTFCCGGGAGGFVRESREPVRIDMMRKNEIKQSGAELLITSCPQCKMMLSGAVEKTKDIVEILAEQIL
ncbi:MAG: (Fe-S)-binding protein, partial [Planctomycetota bacterium]